jgi:hypothetical protein
VDAAAPSRDEIAGRFPVSDQWRVDERRICVRQSRVVLAPVAGVKLAEVFLTRPGLDEPSIRQRR